MTTMYLCRTESILHIKESNISTLAISTGVYQINGSQIGAIDLVGDATVTTTAEIFNSVIGNVTYESSTGDVSYKQLTSPTLNSMTFITNTGDVIELDDASRAPTISVSFTTGSVMPTIRGGYYTPNNSAVWTGADPTTFAAALDRIAAQIGPIA